MKATLTTQAIEGQEMIAFVMKHKRGNAFLDYSELTVAEEILSGIENATPPLVVVNEQGSILGLATLTRFNANTIQVLNVLTSKPSIAGMLLLQFNLNYPSHFAFTYRRGVPHYLDIDKLNHKILGIKTYSLSLI